MSIEPVISSGFNLEGSAPDLLEVDAYVTARMNWDYGYHDPRMWSLYENAKVAQWNVTTDIDWSYDVRFGEPLQADGTAGLSPLAAAVGSPVPPEMRNIFRWTYQAWMVNQFLHGEQGALLCTARLVETVPDMTAKTYAASQVTDEARHVEAYARYIDEKLGVRFPITPGLNTLLRDLLGDSRWDILFLGMQVIVEGLALAATRIASTGFGDPIIRSISKMIARDEARHIAFGHLALLGLYDDMTTAELDDREAFLREAIHLMSQRFLLREIWERLDLDVDAGTRFAKNDPNMIAFRQLLFHKVVQVLRQVGLLSDGVRELLASERLARPDALRA
jgi:P-aminobenzoate N-oxygenase AurF